MNLRLFIILIERIMLYNATLYWYKMYDKQDVEFMILSKMNDSNDSDLYLFYGSFNYSLKIFKTWTKQKLLLHLIEQNKGFNDSKHNSLMIRYENSLELIFAYRFAI